MSSGFGGIEDDKKLHSDIAWLTSERAGEDIEAHGIQKMVILQYVGNTYGLSIPEAYLAVAGIEDEILIERRNNADQT